MITPNQAAFRPSWTGVVVALIAAAVVGAMAGGIMLAGSYGRMKKIESSISDLEREVRALKSSPKASGS